MCLKHSRRKRHPLLCLARALVTHLTVGRLRSNKLRDHRWLSGMASCRLMHSLTLSGKHRKQNLERTAGKTSTRHCQAACQWSLAELSFRLELAAWLRMLRGGFTRRLPPETCPLQALAHHQQGRSLGRVRCNGSCV